MSIYPYVDDSLTLETRQFPIVIGFSSLQRGIVLPHHHQFYEISIYFQGEAVDIVNGTQIASSRGTVICKGAHRIHESRSLGEGYGKYNLMFDLDMLLAAEADSELKRCFHYNVDGEQAPFFQLNEQQIQLVERLCEDIYKEYKAEQPFKLPYIRSKLIEILVHLARARQSSLQNGEEAERAYRPALGSSKAAQALQYINSHFLMDLSLGALADKFDISEAYLSKMIRRMTGKTFTEYVHDLRIDMACSLLVSTKMSILDVAAESGYGSFKTFSRVFCQKKEMTPSKYRRQHGQLQ